MALWRAEALRKRGKSGDAEALLRASIDLFPGETRRRDEVRVTFPYNSENHLSYALLSRMAVDGIERSSLLHAAFVRSWSYERATIGDSPGVLAAIEESALARRARDLRDEARRDLDQLVEVAGFVMTRSPLCTPIDAGWGVAAERRMTFIPEFARAYLAVELSEADTDLAAEVLSTYARDGVILAHLGTEIRRIYERKNESGPLVGDPIRYLPGDRMLTILLADIARFRSVGLTLGELRAWYGLVDDAAALRRVERALRGLRQRERQDSARTLGR